ncbi:hypothetical protein N657DRAFT_306538 [Parathielavia appendiculata]|uniref:Uncharacterized protein n=1 Tax=Parathielavia appendiculata TaxID=2587402 RepID=A0AAN6Z5F4_9PEZI|nr:hypothetical protein N657DRAFT_306538 [Parathielavia appendiculata]
MQGSAYEVSQTLTSRQDWDSPQGFSVARLTARGTLEAQLPYRNSLRLAFSIPRAVILSATLLSVFASISRLDDTIRLWWLQFREHDNDRAVKRFVSRTRRPPTNTVRLWPRQLATFNDPASRHLND